MSDSRWIPIRLDRGTHARLRLFAESLDATGVYIIGGEDEADITRVSLGRAVAVLLDRMERHRERGRRRRRVSDTPSGEASPPDHAPSFNRTKEINANCEKTADTIKGLEEGNV